MKYIIFFVLFTLFAIFFACKKDPIVPPPPPEEDKHIIELGRMSMLRDGKPLSFPTAASVYKVDGKKTTSIGFRLIKNNLDEGFLISDLPEKTGITKIEFDHPANQFNQIPSVLMGWIYEGDQGMGNINVDTTRSDNWLEVIHYDSIKQTLEGRFEVHMKNYFPTIYTGIPKKLDITDGKFYVRIK